MQGGTTFPTAVNAYTMHYDLGGRGLHEDMNNLSTTKSEASSASTGMQELAQTLPEVRELSCSRHRDLVRSRRLLVWPGMRPMDHLLQPMPRASSPGGSAGEASAA